MKSTKEIEDRVSEVLIENIDEWKMIDKYKFKYKNLVIEKSANCAFLFYVKDEKHKTIFCFDSEALRDVLNNKHAEDRYYSFKYAVEKSGILD